MKKTQAHVLFIVTIAFALTLTACTSQGEPKSEATPASEIAGYVGPPRVEEIVKCINELGWDAELNWDGGVSFGTVPPEQINQLNADQQTCVEKFPSQQLNLDGIRDLYAAEVANSDCLAGLGYQMPKPPTEQAYVDAYGTADQWFAMVGASPEAMPEKKYQEAFTACPPPAWQL